MTDLVDLSVCGLNVLRVLVIVGSGVVAGVALSRAWINNELRQQLAVVALAVYSAATSVSQLSLVRKDPTPRTYIAVVAVAFGLAYVANVIKPNWKGKR